MQYMKQHEAEDRVVDRLIQILTDKFEIELVELFNLDGDNLTQTGGSGVYTPGVYLPAPAVANYIRQSGPTAGQAKDLGHVSAFVAALGESVPITRNGGDTSGGLVYTMQQTFAVAFVFGRSANSAVNDADTSRNLREEELFVKRARYYTGAIAHTIWKHARGLVEIRRIEPGPRNSEQVEMQVAESRYELVGVSSFEFSVYNHQLFPAFA